MKRFLLGIILTAAIAASALAQGNTYKVMMITFRGMTPAEQGFIEYLKARLPVEFVIRDVDRDRSKVREFVAEAKSRRVDLIYTFGTTVTLDTVGAAGKVDPNLHVIDIPVVFNIVADPVGAGLASAFAATGRNLTGVSHLVPMPDQLRAMQRFRKVRKLGVIYNSLEANSKLAVEQLRQLAPQFQFDLIEVPLLSGQTPDAREIGEAVHRLLASKPDFVYLPSDSSLIERAAMIVGLASAAGVPVISATEDPIRKAGALMGLVSNYSNAGDFAGYKAEQILAGKAAVGKVPIDTLQRFALVVSMKTAIQLGVYPPLDLIKIAELL
jgi:putative tryptophan/tyrosine transport system substrate-binding protein